MNIYRLDMGSPEGLILFYSAPVIVIALIIIAAGIISAVRFALKIREENRRKDSSDDASEGDDRDER